MTTRINRTVLALLGLVLIGAGGFGLARGFGAFAALPEDEPILSDHTRSWVEHHHGAFWAAVAVAGLVIAVLAIIWLRQQLRTSLPANQDLTRTSEGGRTRVLSGDAAAALAEQIESWPGVEDATARLVGTPEQPTVLLRVGVAADTDVAEVCRRIDAEALPGLRRCLELETVGADLELRMRSREGRQVA